MEFNVWLRDIAKKSLSAKSPPQQSVGRLPATQCGMAGEDGGVYGSNLPSITLVVVTLPCLSRTEMFCEIGRPLSPWYVVLVVTVFPSLVMAVFISLMSLPLLS